MLTGLELYEYIRGFTYWSWMGTIYLIFLTFKDFKNKRIIDDRHNFVMLGSTIALLSHMHRSLVYMLIITAVSLGLRWYLKKFNAVGGADISALTWIFLGFGIINMFKLAWFGVFFILATLLYSGLRLWLFKCKQPTPFFPVILVSFWFNCFVFKLY